jgi:gamma-glutamylcyclotransferase (GGCT)/AIG2-like uncharacterized protein YtfP
MRLFAYGTLMRGDVRAFLLRKQKFLGTARTAPRYRLVDCGEYPGLLRDEVQGRSIEGELYEIEDDCWPSLDEAEGVDEGLYGRDCIELLPPHTEARAEAYFYLGPAADLPDCGGRWQPHR